MNKGWFDESTRMRSHGIMNLSKNLKDGKHSYATAQVKNAQYDE